VQWPIKLDNGVEDTPTGSFARPSLQIGTHHSLAHVLFSSPAAAQDAVKKLHAHVFKGALLSVTLKKRLDGAAKLHHTSTPTPSRANRLIVRNLPFDITEKDLRAIFLPHGSIYSIDIPRIDADNPVKTEEDESSSPLRGKGFAFVWMWNRKEAETAMNACNGMQVRAGFATDLIKDKQKKKKARREEKKQAVTSKDLDDSARTIAVDWALSKTRWEEEKRDLHEEKEPESQGEQGSNEDTESLPSTTERPDERDDEEGSVVDSDHREVEDDEEKSRPSLPQPEAGTTLFIRNIPFLATEDELRTL
jgi:nucleolar protein 4